MVDISSGVLKNFSKYVKAVEVLSITIKLMKINFTGKNGSRASK